MTNQNPNQYTTISDVLGILAPHATEGVEVTPTLIAHRFRDPCKKFSDAIQSAVLKTLIKVSSESFGADMSPYWKLRAATNYFGRLEEFVLITNRKREIVGWSSHAIVRSMDDAAIIYIDSTGLIPEYQSTGAMTWLARHVWLPLAKHERCHKGRVFLTARTENPIFYKLLARIVPIGKIHPAEGTSETAEVMSCARHLADWLGQAALLEPNSLILRNAYSAVDELYDKIPTTGDPQLDRLFSDVLGPLDAYLIVAEVEKTDD